MPHRFFAPDARSGLVVTLPEEEGVHLARVLRLDAGASVIVFDGRGHEFEAVVDRVSKSAAQVRVGDRREPRAEPRVGVTLAQAVLKGEKMDDVVRDAVMIGAAAVLPLVTARAEVTAAALLKSRRLERWRRIAVSSAKQCGRAVIPTLLEPRPFDALAGAIAGGTLPRPALMFVEPGAATSTMRLEELERERPALATIVIGPEGGWTPEELVALPDVCRRVTIGDRVLRADAMALVALSALFAVWGEF